MDEQKQIIASNPGHDQDRYAQLTGSTEGKARGGIEKGHRPSLKINRVRMVNTAALTQ